MKKILFFIISLSSFAASAQNLQLHYDLGDDRKFFTSTIEMFKPDKLGNTFFFVDMDYNSGDVKGVSLAYFEIARVLKTEKMPIGIHVEYNGGFGQFNTGAANMAYQINDACLAGIDYSINAADFSKGISFKALYKYIRDKHDASFQFTTVWFVHFLDNKMTFRGFADFWREDSDFNNDGTVDGEYIFLSEPQIWYHLNKTFSAGSEIELSNNFGGVEGFKIRPTVAVKWNF